MRTIGFTLALGLVLVATGEGVAQNGAAKSARATLSAAELIARAEQIQHLDSMVVRARLYEQAARLTAGNDPQIGSLLTLAGVSYYYVGKKDRAKELFLRAAAAAEQQNDAVTAADAYTKAMVVAGEQGNRSEVRVFIDRLVMLASSPSLPEAERSTILRRISVPLAALTPAPRQ